MQDLASVMDEVNVNVLILLVIIILEGTGIVLVFVVVNVEHTIIALQIIVKIIKVGWTYVEQISKVLQPVSVDLDMVIYHPDLDFEGNLSSNSNAICMAACLVYILFAKRGTDFYEENSNKEEIFEVGEVCNFYYSYGMELAFLVESNPEDSFSIDHVNKIVDAHCKDRIKIALILTFFVVVWLLAIIDKVDVDAIKENFHSLQSTVIQGIAKVAVVVIII